MNSFTLKLFSVAVVLSGCATPVAKVSAHTDGPQTPLVVTVEEVWRGEAGAQLKVVVRKSSASASVNLQLELPPGVVATGLEAELAADFVGERTISVQLTWSSAAVPSSDVKVIATMSGHAMGATAVAHYRFGRAAEPIEAVPTVPLQLQAGALRIDAAAPLEVTPPRGPGLAPTQQRAMDAH